MIKMVSHLSDKGCFISFEGADGAGKTTQIQLLSQYLAKHNIPFLCTYEPGGTALADALRHMVLGGSSPLDVYTELLLLTAARRDHVERIIKPALSTGKWVLCDRFYHSTLAYQGGGRNIPYDIITSLHQQFLNNIMPDVTFLLDIPFEIASLRMEGRTQKSHYDRMQADMYHKIQAGFSYALDHRIGRIVKIDATHSADQIAHNIQEYLKANHPLI